MVLTEKKNRVSTITLNNPEKRNALGSEMVDLLKEAFSAAFNDPETKVVVLAANGPAFCAGADLKYLQQLQKNSYQENLEDSKSLMELFYMIYRGPKPVIAKIQGHAIAGGAGLASVCDFSLSAPEAKFGYTEVRIGFIPALVSVFLVRKIGEGNARSLLLTGELIEANEASKLGLISKIVPGEELDEATNTLCHTLTEKCSGESLRLTKELLAEIQESGLQGGLSMAAEKNALARNTDDCKKGIQAFLDKESIKW